MLITLEALQEDPVRFDQEFAAGQIEYGVPGLRQVAPLHVDGVASAIEAEIHVQGHLRTAMEAECARCLDPVVTPVTRDFDLFYSPVENASGMEDEHSVPKGEEELGFYTGEGLLLEEVAKEQVLLNLPMRTICRDDCKGLCPTCGANRNREACQCKDTGGDPRWAALKNL